MNLSQQQKQQQTLTPQMMQSMEILQMGTQELLTHIEETLQENPVLEPDDTHRLEDEFALLRRKLDWLEQSDPQNSYYYRNDSEEDSDPLRTIGVSDFDDTDFIRYVSSQLDEAALGTDLYQACILLIESLNGSGYLDELPETLAQEFNCEVSLMEQALEEVQSLEPAGVAARSLRECLMLQLHRRGEEDGLAYQIADRYLQELSKNRYPHLAKELDVDAEAIYEAAEQIRKLSPRPAAGFSFRDRLSYITPDVFVVQFQDHFDILTNDYYFPKLNLSRFYIQLVQQTEDPEVKEYLTSKMRQAKLLVSSMEARTSTLLRCARCIVELQQNFFRFGAGHLKPMSLADVAGAVEVHESTVSRAMRDKFLQCSHGVFPMSYFYTRALGGEDGMSTDRAKSLLREIVEAENKQKPLSDQKICELMGAKNCPISRRTVAKYRDELNIPAASARKRL